MPPPQNVTQLLIKWSDGDSTALEELTPLVYDALRKLAGRYLRREREHHSLQPTALVHEAFVRLIDQQTVSLHNRAQFFGLAARLMRNILVDYARERLAAKRGGQQFRLSLSKADRFGRQPDTEIIALNDALSRLAALKPNHARLIELRFFAGLSIKETALAMGLSHATVERDWAFARAWLKREMKG
jgi:RNA polymerase sigma factor (TIGR02999 family)